MIDQIHFTLNGRAMTAEELGTTEDNIIVRSSDSAYTPFAGLSSGSRQTYITGRAALEAAREVKDSVLRAASELCHVPADRITIRENRV